GTSGPSRSRSPAATRWGFACSSAARRCDVASWWIRVGPSAGAGKRRRRSSSGRWERGSSEGEENPSILDLLELARREHEQLGGSLRTAAAPLLERLDDAQGRDLAPEIALVDGLSEDLL